MGLSIFSDRKKNQVIEHAPGITVLESPELIIPGRVDYDVGVTGGGLAGLALSILLARAGHSVVLFEKEQYPFHRVCGEYISLESWDFLNALGVDLVGLQVPIIRKIRVAAMQGRIIEQQLPLGGFGISRYLLDFTLAELAREAGVIIAEKERVNEIIHTPHGFSITTSKQVYSVRMACGSFGKRSNLDLRWKRPFTTAIKNKLNNYIGVKYHIRVAFPVDTIAMYSFPQGYCGLVKVEGDKFNLCYLTTAANLRKSENSFEILENNILSLNPQLGQILASCERSMQAPVTIAQISFDKKSLVEDHVLLLGDAAGMITPLCGNGMSMALHAGKIASGLIHQYLSGRMGQQEMEQDYIRAWQGHFASRLRAGRIIQRMSLNPAMMKLFMKTGDLFPGLMRQMIRRTHGELF